MEYHLRENADGRTVTRFRKSSSLRTVESRLMPRWVTGGMMRADTQIQSGYFSKKQMNDELLKQTHGRGWGGFHGCWTLRVDEVLMVRGHCALAGEKGGHGRHGAFVYVGCSVSRSCQIKEEREIWIQRNMNLCIVQTPFDRIRLTFPLRLESRKAFASVQK